MNGWRRILFELMGGLTIALLTYLATAQTIGARLSIVESRVAYDPVRVSVLETKQFEAERRLERIEEKIDELLNRP